MKIFWFIPTHGDSRYLGTSKGARQVDHAYMKQIAVAVDNLGYEGVLIPTGRSCEDPWITAASLIDATKNLKFLVALRPGVTTPALAARMAATFDRLSNGRVLLNLVTGGDEQELKGELDFQQSFRARVALLKGMDASVLPQIAERLTVTEGAERLISTLKALGYRTAILSGGFQYFAEYLQEKLGIDEVHANCLDVADGMVTGEVKGHIVDGARKAFLLRELAERMGISLEQTIAVGDGANDLPMLSIAGLGVAFRAKPLVRQNANQAISSVGLDGVLYLLGVHDKDLSRA